MRSQLCGKRRKRMRHFRGAREKAAKNAFASA
jgi:hypothetical protein